MKPAKIWANLAIKDIARTNEFYKQLGFQLSPGHSSEDLTSLQFGDNNFIINFFREEKLQAAMNGNLADLQNGCEIMFSLSANTKDEVREFAKQAKAAGGTIFREPSADDNGYFYCGFADPDGHKFNVLLMKAGM